MSIIFLIYSHFTDFPLKNTICKRNRENVKNRGNRGQGKKQNKMSKGSPPTKICTGCKKDKPLKEFYRQIEKSDGYRPKCKICEKEIEDRQKIEKTEYAKQFFTF